MSTDLTLATRRAIVGHGGGKGGGGSGIGDTSDTIRSVAYAQIMLLIAEGEIECINPDDPMHFLQGVYFDGVPVQDASGGWNFKGVDAYWRPGTQGQEVVKGFSDVENEVAVGTKIQHSAPAVRTIQATDVDSVRVTLSVSSLYKTNDDGSVSGTSVEYKIELQSNGGGYVQKVNRSISGRVSSKYQRAERIDLTGDPPWDIRVTRVTPDHNSLTIQDDLYWDSYTEIVEGKFAYPNSAVLAVTIDSSQFAHIPTIGCDCKLLRIRVPTNYDPSTRVYTGSWDGSFKIAWTNNPAWVYYDLLTSERYGLGHYLDESQIDKSALYVIAQYCDGSVTDGNGGTEPRFTCNVYLQKRDEAYTVLQNLAACFRGISYWGGGTLVAVQDAPGDPKFLYNQANVIGGTFTYQGASLQARHTVALVQWNDPQQQYKQQVEYVEEEEGIARFGIVQTEIVAFGCTSRGQAQRVGRWLLLSEKYCSETVSFSCGLEGIRAKPGDVIEVADAARAGVRMGGRVLTGCTKTSIKLDAAVTLAASESYTLDIIATDGEIASSGVSTGAGETSTLTLATALPAAPAPGAMWLLKSDALEPQLFRLTGIEETEPNIYQLTGVRHVPAIYSAVDNDTRVVPPTISVLGVPDEPHNLTLTEAVHHSGSAVSLLISAGWDSVLGVSGWIVSYSIDGGNVIVLPQTNVPHVEIPLSRQGVYDVTVVAVNQKGTKSIPATASATFDGKALITLTAPDVTAIGTADGIDLAWAAIDNAYSYLIERSVNGSSGWAVRADTVRTLHWRDPLIDGSQYFYRVTAVDHFGGESAPSAVVSATAKTVADGATATQIYRQESEPTLAVKGDLWYNPSTGAFKRWNGSTWEPVSAATYHQASAPSNPLVGDFWFDTDNSSWSRWNGTAWVQLATIGADWFSDVRGRPLHQQNLIVKSDFEDGAVGDWSGDSANEIYTVPESSQPFTYSMRVKYHSAASFGDAAEAEQTRFPVRPGQRIFRGGWLRTLSSGVAASLVVAFEDSTGARFSWLGPTLAAGQGMQYIRGIITAPAGAAFALGGYIKWHPTADDDYIDVGPQDCSLFAAEVYRLQGGTNIQVGSFSAHWDAYTFTASRTGNAGNYNYKLAWGGGTLHSHGLDIPAYAMHTWSGLDAATDYFCSFDDIGLAGSPSAYYASTDPGTWDAAPERVPIPGPNTNGSVTTMDTGGNGGGGDGGWHPPSGGSTCVTTDMWVLLESGEYKRARDVRAGDLLAAWKCGERISGGKPVLRDPPIVAEQSVRVEADGATLTCSLTTPFDDRDGGELWGLDIAGRDVVTWRGQWSRCTAEPIGEREVCYISLGGYAYAAGAEPGKWIVSHNTVRPVKP